MGLRFFNIYGPRQDPRSPYSGVVAIFAERLSNDKPITIFGDGAQTRDFVFVADAVQALLAAMALPPPGAQVFNVCSGTAVSILELANHLGAIIGTAPKIRFAPARTGEIRHSVGTSEALRRVLGLGRPLPMRVGLTRLLAGEVTE